MLCNLEFSFSDFQSKFWLTSLESSVRKILICLSFFILLVLLLRIVQENNLDNYFLVVLLFLISVVVFLFFISNNLLLLYVTFELSLVPIFIIIIGWGYQSERLNASLRILLYTLTASLPLLLTLIFLESFSLSSRILTFGVSNLNFLIRASLLIAFLVKTPLFLVHLWLPKAHVEAPVYGSIMLASILLKLGTYGVLTFIIKIYRIFFLNLIFSVSFLSCFLVRLRCVRILDLKVLIAYSSVAHIALVIFLILILNKLRGTRAVGIILSHGFSSAGLFYLAFLVYTRSHRRRLVLNKRRLRIIPIFSLWLFLVLILNMAAPPSFNLLVELLIVVNLMNIYKVLWPGLLICIVTTTAYSLLVYASVSQTQRNSPENKEVLSELENLTSFISIAPPLGLSIVRAYII